MISIVFWLLMGCVVLIGFISGFFTSEETPFKVRVILSALQVIPLEYVTAYMDGELSSPRFIDVLPILGVVVMSVVVIQLLHELNVHKGAKKVVWELG